MLLGDTLSVTAAPRNPENTNWQRTSLIPKWWCIYRDPSIGIGSRVYHGYLTAVAELTADIMPSWMERYKPFARDFMGLSELHAKQDLHLASCFIEWSQDRKPGVLFAAAE